MESKLVESETRKRARITLDASSACRTIIMLLSIRHWNTWTKIQSDTLLSYMIIALKQHFGFSFVDKDCNEAKIWLKSWIETHRQWLHGLRYKPMLPSWMNVDDKTPFDCSARPVTRKIATGSGRKAKNADWWLTVQRGQDHSPSGTTVAGGLRQLRWYEWGQVSQISRSPPSLQTVQNSMWSSAFSSSSSLSSSPSSSTSKSSSWSSLGSFGLTPFLTWRSGLAFLSRREKTSTAKDKKQSRIVLGFVPLLVPPWRATNYIISFIFFTDNKLKVELVSDQWFSTLGLFASFLESRKLLIKIFIVSSTFYISYAEPNFCCSQNNRITWQKW